MKISIKAKPSAREDKIKKIDEKHFEVAVKEPPIAGRANKAIIRLLGEYFQVDVSQVKIISGRISKNKTIEIA